MDPVSEQLNKCLLSQFNESKYKSGNHKATKEGGPGAFWPARDAPRSMAGHTLTRSPAVRPSMAHCAQIGRKVMWGTERANPRLPPVSKGWPRFWRPHHRALLTGKSQDRKPALLRLLVQDSITFPVTLDPNCFYKALMKSVLFPSVNNAFKKAFLPSHLYFSLPPTSEFTELTREKSLPSWMSPESLHSCLWKHFRFSDMNLLVQIIAARKLEHSLPDGKGMTWISKKMQVWLLEPSPCYCPWSLGAHPGHIEFFCASSCFIWN